MSNTMLPATSRSDRFEDEVRALTGRSLYLLAAIDRTNEALHVDKLLFDMISTAGRDLADRLKTTEALIERDKVNTLETLIRGVLEPLRNRYEECKLGRDAASRDARLLDDDGVVDSYESCIDALSSAYDGIAELLEAIGEYDVELEGPLPEQFSSSEDLIAALRS